MSKVQFSGRAVRIDGKPIQIASGAIHYFRVPEQLWRDRLLKARQCGLNCVETYLCWNLHEPREGHYDFSGILDFESFIHTAQELGLYVIVRPGPFICAEWDNGGFPAWLMTKPGIEFRRMNTVYLDAVRAYYQVILPKLKKLQYDEGGPIIAMQVENEYGSYGHDRDYLRALRQICIDGGITVPLFTADGACDICIQGGLLEGSPMALTFGSAGIRAFELGRRYRPDDPSFCMEFWGGWFDHWATDRESRVHHTRGPEEVANETDDMLREGGSINFYMFHGGTNFAFTAGANGTGARDYAPDTTSYDYDAPLSEAGDPTPKYFLIQDVLRKYFPDAPFGTPEPSRKQAYGKIRFSQVAPLFDNLDAIGEKTHDLTPRTMEALGQNFGFLHYRTHLDGPLADAQLVLRDAKDRAQVFLNGKLFWTYYRNDETAVSPLFTIPEHGLTLDILTENMARINYGPLAGRDFKGLCGGVSIGNQFRFGWDEWTLPMDNLEKLAWRPFVHNLAGTPAFYRAEFQVDETADTFVVFPGVKGVVWVNGHNLGRYWNVGPSKTLYLPGVYLRSGVNEIIVFETESLERGVNYVRLTDTHELN